MIRITTIIFALFWLIAGGVPTYFATMEYAELKAAAKPMQDREDLKQLGFIPDAVDSNEVSWIR